MTDLYGAFAEHPEILEHFQEDDAFIEYAGDDCIVYSDGFILPDPLKLRGISPKAMDKLLMYLDNVIGYLKEPVPGDTPDERAAFLVGEALDLWREDLEHAAGEYEKKSRHKPKAKFDDAVAYAQANPNTPLSIVADKTRTKYHHLTAELRHRA